MATGYWKLEGRQLKSVSGIGIGVPAGSKSIDQRVRQSLVALHGGTQDRQSLGRDLPTMSIEFRLYGRGVEKYAERALIQEVLETVDCWTLEAPTNGRVWKNFPRAAFSTLTDPQDDMEGTGRISLKVTAVLNGAWIADGGDYEYCTAGYFTKQPDGTWVDQDGTNTGASPTVELSAQVGGYPLAIENAVGYAKTQPTLVSMRSASGPDGETVWFATYDLTGYLFNPAGSAPYSAPTAAGDVGTYKICSSPDAVSLSGGTASGLPLGIDEGAVDEYEVDGLTLPIDLLRGGMASGAIASAPIARV